MAGAQHIGLVAQVFDQGAVVLLTPRCHGLLALDAMLGSTQSASDVLQAGQFVQVTVEAFDSQGYAQLSMSVPPRQPAEPRKGRG